MLLGNGVDLDAILDQVDSQLFDALAQYFHQESVRIETFHDVSYLMFSLSKQLKERQNFCPNM